MTDELFLELGRKLTAVLAKCSLAGAAWEEQLRFDEVALEDLLSSSKTDAERQGYMDDLEMIQAARLKLEKR